MASMRRTPLETEVFAGQLEEPDLAGGRGVRAAAELGRKSSDSFTTRTLSPYFSPNSAIAWYSFTATSMGTSTSVSTVAFFRTSRFTMVSMS